MSREKKERTGGRKEKSCGIKKTKNRGKSENKEERVIRVKWGWKEDGGVGKKGGEKKEEEGWGMLTTYTEWRQTTAEGNGELAGIPYSDPKAG